MEQVSITFFNWINEETEKLTTRDSDWKGSFVSHCIPKRYRTYCKILQPMYRDNKVSDEKLMWHQCNPKEEFEFDFGEKMTYKALTEKYNLSYSKEISTNTFLHNCGGLPRYLISPDEGTLETQIVKEIVNILKPFVKEQNCYYFYDLLKTKNYSEMLYRGNIEDVFSLCANEAFRGSPTYWWAEDKSWCLYTDFDLDFTLLGGSDELIQTVLTNKNIEAIEIDADTRIDSKADWRNRFTDKDN